MLIRCRGILDLNMNIMTGTARKRLKYLKCVDDNCPGRATLKNGNTEHAQRESVTEEISNCWSVPEKSSGRRLSYIAYF